MTLHLLPLSIEKITREQLVIDNLQAQQWKDETKRFLENYRNVSHAFGRKSYHFINEGNNFHKSKIISLFA